MSTSSLMPFWRVISIDLNRYGDGVLFRSFCKHYILTPGFKYTFWFRLSAYLKQKNLIWRGAYYVSRFFLYRCGIKYGISIPFNTRIGFGLYVGHYGGIIINEKVVLGRDCNINHEVTIGVKYGGKHSGVPIIGDRAYLGPGCKIIGGITLGNDVAVGANAVVVESVPDSSIVVGVPAKIISFRGSSDYVVRTGMM